MEFDLLEILMLRRPRVVSSAQLEDSLYTWNQRIESNAIQVYIHYLRRKLAPNLIETVRGQGYRMAPEPARESGKPSSRSARH